MHSSSVDENPHAVSTTQVFKVCRLNHMKYSNMNDNDRNCKENLRIAVSPMASAFSMVKVSTVFIRLLEKLQN
jgi:hypothetical protein